jgi:PAS domain S-box-containing protein
MGEEYLGVYIMSQNRMPEDELISELDYLREQVAEYDAIFNSSPVMFWCKDTHNRLLRINDAAAKFEGKKPQDLIGKLGQELYPKEQSEAFYQDDLEVIKSGKAKLGIVELHTTPGLNKTHWLNVCKVPKLDENGIVIGVIALAVDISEQKNSELELVQARTLLDTVLNGIYDPIFVKDEEHRYLVLNENMCDMMKHSRAELLGKSDYDFFPKEQADIFWEHDDKVLHSDAVDRNEEHFTREGQTRILSTIKSSFINPITGKRNLVGSIRDITDRKKAESEIHQLRNYLENIINSMPSVMIGVNKDGYVTQWNLEASRATGVKNEDAIGQLLATVFPRLSPDMHGVHEAITTQREVIAVKRMYQENGQKYYEDITIYPLIAMGEEGAVIRVDDVSEQVKIEEMMIQTDKMLSVGGLAAGMAHEINNPLAGMMQTADVMTNRLSSAELLANLAAAADVGTSMNVIQAFMEKRGILRMLGDIHESGVRVSDIVNNMLSFSRKSDSTRVCQNINDLLDKAITISSSEYDLKKQYDFKSISVIRDYDDTIPLVLCEEVKIQQVFLNLFRNGAEAMHEANVKAPTFTVRSYYDEKHARVVVVIEDNGLGMDEEISKRIFEPFFTTKAIGAGTGLGLSVSYFIITENHGGEMTVESERGKGTRFYIQLPCDNNGEQP